MCWKMHCDLNKLFWSFGNITLICDSQWPAFWICLLQPWFVAHHWLQHWQLNSRNGQNKWDVCQWSRNLGRQFSYLRRCQWSCFWNNFLPGGPWWQWFHPISLPQADQCDALHVVHNVPCTWNANKNDKYIIIIIYACPTTHQICHRSNINVAKCENYRKESLLDKFIVKYDKYIVFLIITINVSFKTINISFETMNILFR